MKGLSLAAGTALATSLFIVSAASAQTPPQTSTPNAPATATGTDNGALDDIVVTAKHADRGFGVQSGDARSPAG
ncbi:hypothetical protein BH09PSE3_BH09PSE3_19500 [soil metagenome]